VCYRVPEAKTNVCIHTLSLSYARTIISYSGTPTRDSVKKYLVVWTSFAPRMPTGLWAGHGIVTLLDDEGE